MLSQWLRDTSKYVSVELRTNRPILKKILRRTLCECMCTLCECMCEECVVQAKHKTSLNHQTRK